MAARWSGKIKVDFFQNFCFKVYPCFINFNCVLKFYSFDVYYVNVAQKTKEWEAPKFSRISGCVLTYNTVIKHELKQNIKN